MSQIETTQSPSTSLSSTTSTTSCADRIAAAESVIRFFRDAEASLDVRTTLSPDERKKLLRLAKRQPPFFLQTVCELADRHGGSILGMTFDTKACRDALAEDRQARALIRYVRKSARRVEERAAAGLVPVLDQAMSVTAVLERMRHTPEGQALTDELADLRTTQKRRRKPRAAKAPPAVPVTPVTPTVPGTPVTPVAAGGATR